jgi:hypothetical protein
MEPGATRRPASSRPRSERAGKQSGIAKQSESGSGSGGRKKTRRAKLVRPGEMWGRRSVAVGVLLVAIAVIGGLILLVTGNDDGDSGTGPQPTADLNDLQNRFLDRTVVIPSDGISVRRPANWQDSKEDGVITLLSPNRCVSVSMSAPAGTKGAKGLMDDSLSALRQTYNKVEVVPGGQGAIGGVPTTSRTIQLTDSNGNRRRILIGVGTGNKNAYLTQVVLGNPSCQGELALAQVVLSSAEFTK